MKGLVTATAVMGLVSAVATPAPAQAIHPQWSPDGQFIAYYHRTGNLAQVVVVRPDGSDLETVPLPRGYHSNPTWSPDGKQLAYASGRPTMSGSWDLYALAIDGGDERRLTESQAREAHASWSPTGAWIAFIQMEEGGSDVFMVRPDGTGLTRVTRTTAREFHPKFSPQGHFLAYDAGEGDTRQIVVLDVGAETARTITRFGTDTTASTPAWHPDGRRLAFSLSADGDRSLYVVNVDGSDLTRLPAEGDPGAPFWSPDGRFVAYHTQMGDEWAIQVLEIATGAIRQVSPSGGP